MKRRVIPWPGVNRDVTVAGRVKPRSLNTGLKWEREVAVRGRLGTGLFYLVCVCVVGRAGSSSSSP